METFLYLSDAIPYATQMLLSWGTEIDTGHWQGVPTEGRPELITKELLDLKFAAHMPGSMEEAQTAIRPSLPWAEAHFMERVGREPTNPGLEYANWPWWRGQYKSTASTVVTSEVPDTGQFQFTHTYQERFWPKHANMLWGSRDPADGSVMRGIRYEFGDLDDVVALLRKEPHTRQAYLPIFFPEDTGAVHGGRIPCTLGYHFMLRNGKLHCWYDIRSCDLIRHFRDDLYLAVRLVQWVLEELNWDDVIPGYLYFSAHSFHVHKGDMIHVSG